MSWFFRSPSLSRINHLPFANRYDLGHAIISLVFLILLPISTPRIYATDEVQYYAYVRSLYVDGDLDFRNEYQYFADRGLEHGDQAVYHALLRDRPDDPPINPKTGKIRNLAPIGAALLWSPGFILTDLGVRVLNLTGANIPTDGYAKPYIWSVCFMSALYSFIGLLLCYRLARRFVGIFAATLSVMTVWLASPLVFYTYIAMPWGHATGFFLFSLFLNLLLWGWDKPLAERLAQRPLWNWVLLGVVGGLMSITREQLGLMMVLPTIEGIMAYSTYAIAKNGNWIADVKRLFIGHAVFLICFLLALVPQLLTYRVLNGRFGPSTVVSGKLSAGSFSPHFFDTLFDVHHGAFLWSPILFIGLCGLFLLVRRDWLLALLLFAGFLAQTYVNGSFGTTWHLSRSFGFRRLIECTPLFILGFALFVQPLHVRLGQWPLLFIAGFLIYWNVGLIAQWTIVRPELRVGLIWDNMLYYQFVEVPQRVTQTFSDLLFNRCRLYKNQTCS